MVERIGVAAGTIGPLTRNPIGLAALTVALLLSSGAQAVDLRGQLTGEWAAWGPIRIEALRSRDFAVPPAADSEVDSDGRFLLSLPEGTSEVYLALWPTQGGAFPLLLKELPYALPVAEPIVIPLPPPPQHRAQRHAQSAPSVLLIGGGLLLLLALFVFGGRALAWRLRRARDRWVPTAAPVMAARWPLWGLLTGVGALLAYGVFALDEALDLLEYTYFQEAFSGSNPIEVALSPIVAERAHAPGYAVFLWALTSLSAAPSLLRLPALLAGLAAIAVIHRLCTDATGSRWTALLAAGFAAFAPLAMRYGRDLTPYSVVGLLSVTSTWLLYRALRSGARREWAGYAACSVLAFFLHYFTAFLVVGQALSVLWLWARGGRGPHWTARLREALAWFGALAVLPMLWAAQVVRAFIISAQDNLVTHAVYPEAPGFATYVLEHVRVLVGLPLELQWAVWPLLIVLGYGAWALLRDHPGFGRLLLIPLVLMGGLLVTTYFLHSYAYGGHVYYGWRWLRPYVPAVAIPLAYGAIHPPRLAALRPAVWAVVAFAMAGSVFAGGRSAVRRERPAQRAAAKKLLELAEPKDAIAVLPAAFYTVGWSFYLRGESLASVHRGPSKWEYVPRGDGHIPVFGPIRSFGIPLESVAEHVDIRRLWVCVFREVIFGQPEFDESLPNHVIAHLDRRLTRKRTLRYPHLDLILYELPEPDPYRDPNPPRVELQRLYRALRWLPDGLDPDYLFRVVRGEAPVVLRFPGAAGATRLKLRVSGAPSDATVGSVRLNDVALTFEGGVWDGILLPQRSGPFTVELQRTDEARRWPLVLELRR